MHHYARELLLTIYLFLLHPKAIVSGNNNESLLYLMSGCAEFKSRLLVFCLNIKIKFVRFFWYSNYTSHLCMICVCNGLFSCKNTFKNNNTVLILFWTSDSHSLKKLKRYLCLGGPQTPAKCVPPLFWCEVPTSYVWIWCHTNTHAG